MLAVHFWLCFFSKKETTKPTKQRAPGAQIVFMGVLLHRTTTVFSTQTTSVKGFRHKWVSSTLAVILILQEVTSLGQEHKKSRAWFEVATDLFVTQTFLPSEKASVL